MATLPAGFALNPLKTEEEESLTDLQGQAPSQQTPSPALPSPSTPQPSGLPAGFQMSQQQATLPAGFQMAGEEPEFDPETAEWGDVLREAGKNLPSSVLQLGKDMVTPWLSPVESAQGLYNVVAGAFQKVVPGEQGKEQYADLLVDYYKDRYGSIKGFKNALAKDPAGVLSDGASILIPGGQAVRGLGTAAKIKQLTRLSQMAQKAGKGITRLGTAMDPLGGAAEAVGQVLGKAGVLLDKGRGVEKPVEMYRQAANFSTTIPVKDQRKLAKFALDEKIMPTLKAMDGIRGKINVLATQINDMIDRGTTTGKAVPIKRFFREFRALQDQAGVIDPTSPMKARKVVAQIRKQMHEFNEKVKGGRDLPIDEVQSMKQNIYQNLEKYYSQVRAEPMKVKTQMAVARAARESLEEFFPEISNLNKREGMLLELHEALAGPAARIDKQKFWNVMTSVRAAGGGAIAGPTGVAAGLVASVYNQPKIKAKLAIIGNSLRQRGIQLSPLWTELRILPAVGERAEREQEE